VTVEEQGGGVAPIAITDESLVGLPAPVQRSLQRSGVLGEPVPSLVSLSQRGEILLGNRWMPFTATESYTLTPPSFRWEAVVRFAGVPLAWANDSLTDGRGRMHVRILRLFTVVDETGPEMNQGAVMRWLNETMWFPHVWTTDIISWTPVDDRSAIGSVTVGDLTVEAEFRFDDVGRLIDFHADRYRIDNSGSELAPWSTPISGHRRFGDLELPSAGSAVWTGDSGELDYIRLEVTDISFRGD
jgi:hypothetical protein